jgi:BMFP domain-containing protein YqiC
MQAVEDKTPEEQKGILSKSFDLWKKVASATPKLVMESLKDPKKQAAHIQEQIQEQFHHVGDAIEKKIEDTLGQKLEMDDWRVPSKSDYKTMMKMLEKLSSEMDAMNKKIEKLSKKVK